MLGNSGKKCAKGEFYSLALGTLWTKVEHMNDLFFLERRSKSFREEIHKTKKYSV
jgi:hypothetical protein